MLRNVTAGWYAAIGRARMSIAKFSQFYPHPYSVKIDAMLVVANLASSQALGNDGTPLQKGLLLLAALSIYFYTPIAYARRAQQVDITQTSSYQWSVTVLFAVPLMSSAVTAFICLAFAGTDLTSLLPYLLGSTLGCLFSFSAFYMYWFAMDLWQTVRKGGN